MTNEAAFLEDLAASVGKLSDAASDAERASLEALLTPTNASPRTGTPGDASAQSGVGMAPVASSTAANVQNLADNVIIDKNGMTITDGALTFKDASGSTVLDGAGFGPAWVDYIADGLLNSTFARGAAQDPLVPGRTSSLPYWTSAKTGTPTCKIVNNAAWPGGRYVSVNLNAAGQQFDLTSDQVPIEAMGYYGGFFFKQWTAVDAGVSCTVRMVVQYYLADGVTTTGGECIFGTAQSPASPDAIPLGFQCAAYGVIVPTDARYATVTLRVLILSGTPSTATVLLGGAKLLRVLHSGELSGGTPYAVYSLAAPGGLSSIVKAGALSDGDFPTPVDGLFGFNTTNHRLEYREGGAWHYINQTA